MGCIVGKMEGCMKGSICLIRNMGKEFILGLMVSSIEGGGEMESSMGKECIFFLMESRRGLFGMMERGLKLLINDIF